MTKPRPISRRSLILLLLFVSIVPPTFVFIFVASHKPPDEPKLECDVALGLMEFSVAATKDEPASVRLMSSVRLTNPTDSTYRNISIALNKEFYYYYPQALPGGESLELPQEFFVTKSGATSFKVGSTKVNRVTVYAQIPSGARAVAERYFDSQGEPTSAPK